jgi:hypothetical protein
MYLEPKEKFWPIVSHILGTGGGGGGGGDKRLLTIVIAYSLFRILKSIK